MLKSFYASHIYFYRYYASYFLAKYIYGLQMFHGINEAHNAAHHFSKDEFVEGRLVRQKMEKIHLYQTEFYKIAQFEKVGSCISDWRALLQKSKGKAQRKFLYSMLLMQSAC